ncbi:DUF6694 family lipoprotein [Pseudomonas caspiana]|uniref:Lipoprotein n=1 Tax=Pseudomonas caspiana TaxID=1451454 RepID=A0A1Y3NWB2_9PSED|nr:DUF6694 family lipoprotein [Pseudomonas caspiana]OUM71879.1 hypothetical protein AUC60_21390 [Pseudomonas caspiana]
MTIVRNILLSLFFIFIGGCGEPRLDAREHSTFVRSIEKMSNGLQPEKREKFASSIRLLLLASDSKSLESLASDQHEVPINDLRALGGLTVDQVISRAGAVRDQQETLRVSREKELRQLKTLERKAALAEVTELEASENQYARYKAAISNFIILSSKFYQKEQDRFYHSQPVLEVELFNGLTESVHGVYMRGTVKAEDGSVWLKEDFRFKAYEPLQPGEKRDIKLTPDIFSPWGRVNPPQGLSFDVELIRLDISDDESLQSVCEFTDQKKARLNWLLQQYGFRKSDASAP